MTDAVKTFFLQKQQDVFIALQRLKIPNMPQSLNGCSQQTVWQPVLAFEKDQSLAFREEQSQVFNFLQSAVNRVLVAESTSMKNSHVVKS